MGAGLDILGQVGGQAAGTMVGMAIGNATRKWNDRQQVKQARKLLGLQLGADMQLSDYQTEQAMDIWNRTNYPAQVAQLQKAGLNPGLLYAKGGSGGTTIGGSMANVSAGNAQGGTGNEVGMGLTMGHAMNQAIQRTAAEIDLLKAQTEKTKAEAAKTAGVDTGLAVTQTANLEQLTQNAKLQGDILQYSKENARISADIANKTEQEVIDQYRMNNQKLQADVEIARNKKIESDATLDNIIEQSNIQTTQAALNTLLTKASINITKEEQNAIIQKMVLDRKANARAEGYQELDVDKYGFTQQQWYQQMDQNDKNRINDILKSVMSILSKGM